ncbi:MAG: DUF4255 domain-containing protein [Myxococcales bacterium]|nr:DUF4255 domain-containing protein [Myxococcales bacterium]
MADFNAIDAVTQAIERYLDGALPTAIFPNAKIARYRLPHDPDRAIGEGLSLHLYRVATDDRRNLPPRRLPDGSTRRPPLALDLHYLLTAWASTPEVQQRLLGWAMRALADLAELPATLLNHGAAAPSFEPGETVEWVATPITVEEMASVWEPCKDQTSLSATYRARMVLIDSTQTMETAPRVQTRQMSADPSLEGA